MLEALATLLAFQLLGEALTHLVGWPVPGPVVGMALLFIAWPKLPRLQTRLGGVADALLANFGLLFVPAGVGVMLHATLLADWWAPLLVAVITSTAATMAFAAGLFVWLRRRGPGGGGAPPGSDGSPGAPADNDDAIAGDATGRPADGGGSAPPESPRRPSRPEPH